jgi:hypothetical protein
MLVRLLLLALVLAARAATAAPPDWAERKPIDTAGPRSGCKVDLTGAVVTLSVDGTTDGAFLSRGSGIHGEAWIDPGGRSSAHFLLGALDLDTGIVVADSTFRLRARPPTLGGILDVDDGTPVRVVGGDARKLSFEPVDTGDLEWVTAAPRFDVPCKGVGWADRWKDLTWPETKNRLFAARPKIAVRATPDGPVVARITVDEASEVARTGNAVKILALIGPGRIIAWSDADAWNAKPPAPVERNGEKGAVAGMAGRWAPRIACRRGAKLYVIKDDQLYTIGRLSTATKPPTESDDWRFSKGKIVIEGAAVDPASVPWFLVTDDFRVTNAYWLDEIRGELVVPKADCAPVNPPRP